MLLTHFCKFGMGDQAMIWLGKLLKTCFIPNAVTYNIINSAHFRGPRSAKILKEMSRKEFLLNSVMHLMIHGQYDQGCMEMTDAIHNDMLKDAISFSNICSKSVRDNHNEQDSIDVHQGFLREDHHDAFTHDSRKASSLDGPYQEGKFGVDGLFENQTSV